MEEQDPVKIAAKNYRVLFENARVRVLESRLAPGDRTVMHSHPACIAIPLHDHKLRFTLADGTTQEIELKTGDVAWFDSVTHITENIDTVDVRDVIVELKAAAQ